MNMKNKYTDLAVILIITFLSAGLYIGFEPALMAYGRNPAHPLFLRFLPVLIIQFGMSGLGISIVLLKNKEKLSTYGFQKKNTLKSLAGCMLAAVPTVLFLWLHEEIHGFLPFQGMFLTKDILNAPIPFNFLGYLVTAIVWGFFEGLFYVVLSDQINRLTPHRKFLNTGALICALFSILIHGMIGTTPEILLEALATFLLMYGSLTIYKLTGNAWGNILIFFVIWNAL